MEDGSDPTNPEDAPAMAEDHPADGDGASDDRVDALEQSDYADAVGGNEAAADGDDDDDGEESSEPPVADDAGGDPETASDEASKSTDDNEKAADDMDVDAQAKGAQGLTATAHDEEGNETTEESSKELPYSTRGRSTAGSGGEEKAGTGIEPVAETLEELSRPKETLGASFLVETLTEEERRTRTRFIPDVEGMHALRKAEIKDDLTLAKLLPTVVSSKGEIRRRTSRLTSSGGRRARDMDLEEVAGSSNDEGVTTIELPTSELAIPSDVFVTPEGVSVGDNEGTIAIKLTEKDKAKAKAPSHVETTVAFNPPRPPESIGAKKKHRVLRWERRPDDIEVDMKNYRRTVQRTRQELQKSEGELDRLETIDAHLRRHFLNHLDLLNEEHDQLKEMIQSETQKLTTFTGLSGSRTRNRNTPKPSAVMRDVLNLLQKGDMTDVPMEDDVAIAAASTAAMAEIGLGNPGIGGLNVGAFLDWDRSTTMKVSDPAISWLEPGQAVKTPDGPGIVVAVLPIEIAQNNDKDNETSDDEMNDSTAQKTAPYDDGKTELSAAQKKDGGADATAKEEEEKKAAREKEHDKYKSVQPFRVTVRIADREEIFNMDTVVLADNPAHYSDKKLAKRWKGMIKSALEVGPCVDVEGLGSVVTPTAGSNRSDFDSEENRGSTSTSTDIEDNRCPVADEEKPLLPVNASLFPTIAGRGNLLHTMKIADIENELHDALYEGRGVLGRTSNSGITPEFRRWEDDEQEYLTLKAASLQLRNALYRQRRIRMLNERTASSMLDKIQRAEDVVADMRTDLKNLKRKLEDELIELGVSEVMANKILSTFYQGQAVDERGDTSTPKRLKRATSVVRNNMILSAAAFGSAGAGKLSDDDDLATDDMSGDDMDAAGVVASQPPPSKKLRSG